MRRRDLILGGVAVGAAPLLLGGGTASAQEAAPAGGIAGSILSSSDANFQTLLVLGAAGYGAAELRPRPRSTRPAPPAARRPRRPRRSGGSGSASRASATPLASAQTR